MPPSLTAAQRVSGCKQQVAARTLSRLIIECTCLGCCSQHRSSQGSFKATALKHVTGWYGTDRHVCRFVLQPGSVPEQHRLAAQMGILRGNCRGLDSAGCRMTADDFADVILVAGDHTFRSGGL